MRLTKKCWIAKVYTLGKDSIFESLFQFHQILKRNMSEIWRIHFQRDFSSNYNYLTNILLLPQCDKQNLNLGSFKILCRPWIFWKESISSSTFPCVLLGNPKHNQSIPIHGIHWNTDTTIFSSLNQLTC